MGLHEWIMVGIAVVAAAVAAVEIRKSKRPRPEPLTGEAAVYTGPPPVRSRHVLLVGHNAVTRVSIRRKLEQYMAVSEAPSAAEGLARLGEVIDPSVDVTVVVDLTGDQGDTDGFVGDVLTEPRDHPVRLLVVTPDAGTSASEPRVGRIEYLPNPQSIPSLLNAIQRSDGLD